MGKIFNTIFCCFGKKTTRPAPTTSQSSRSREAAPRKILGVSLWKKRGTKSLTGSDLDISAKEFRREIKKKALDFQYSKNNVEMRLPYVQTANRFHEGQCGSPRRSFSSVREHLDVISGVIGEEVDLGFYQVQDMDNSVVSVNFISNPYLVFNVKDDRDDSVVSQTSGLKAVEAVSQLYRYPTSVRSTVPVLSYVVDGPEFRPDLSRTSLQIQSCLDLTDSAIARFPRFDLTFDQVAESPMEHEISMPKVVFLHMIAAADRCYPDSDENFARMLFYGTASVKGWKMNSLKEFAGFVVRAAAKDGLILDIVRPTNERIPVTEEISSHDFMLAWLSESLKYGGSILTAKIAMRFDLLLTVKTINEMVIKDIYPAPGTLSDGLAHAMASLLLERDEDHWLPATVPWQDYGLVRERREKWKEICGCVGIPHDRLDGGPIDDCLLQRESARSHHQWTAVYGPPGITDVESDRPGLRHHFCCENFRPVFHEEAERNENSPENPFLRYRSKRGPFRCVKYSSVHAEKKFRIKLARRYNSQNKDITLRLQFQAVKTADDNAVIS